MPGIVHHFGRVEVRPGERQVLIDGRPAVLGARAFEVLNALIERRDRAVTKDELLDLVWSGVVVQENNLQVQVSSLRKLLGANAIATIPGRGYRFTLDEDHGAEARTTQSVGALPPRAEGLIGRDEDRAHLVDLLEKHRLVVVIGAGGVGKTALAHAVASAANPKSVVGWVELAPVSDFALVPGAIARGLQLQLEGALPDEALLAAARPLTGLLVLDNAEHLVEPLGQLVLRLLEAAPGLRLLVTSQAPLKVDGEWLFRLGPLSCPQAGAPLDDALQHGAVALFVAQACAAGYDVSLDEQNVALVMEICRRVDGIPLAVKLAAARLPLLGLAGLNAGLAQCLKILGGGPSSVRRQATLQAAFDWSHSLLCQREQLVFRRLAVFVGGFTLSAASAVCSDEHIADAEIVDALGGLVDRSLVVVEADAQPRYHLLQAAREYALAQLERSGERVACERRHANAMLALLESSDATYAQECNDELWRVVAMDLDNLRAAMGWSVVHDAALAARLLGEARVLFIETGLLHEARIWSDRVEPLIGDAVPDDAAASFWRLRGQALLGDAPERAAAAALKAVELFRRAGDRRDRFGALNDAIADTLLPLATKEVLLNELRQLDAAGRTEWSRTYLLACEAVVAWLRGDLAAARDTYLRAVFQARATITKAELLTFLARVEQLLGLHEEAIGHARQAMALALGYGPSFRLVALPTLAGVLIESGRIAEAHATLEEAVRLSRRAGWWRFREIALRLACLACHEGRPLDAGRLLGYLNRLSTRIDPLAEPTEMHMQSLAEAKLRATLSADEMLLAADEGTTLTEAAVCGIGLAMQGQKGQSA